MTSRASAADATARRAIREALDRSLIVEAGAGTGKTHSLVDRIEALIVGGRATVDQVVAITFTRAAASELRERVRVRLETRAREERSPAARALVERALEGLDRASIQTIDSFALSLVRERNLEAGVPPVIEPMDEIEAALAFEERWRVWLDGELEAGTLDEPLALAVRLGFERPLMRLLEVARAFHENYRLLAGASFDPPAEPPRTAARSVVRAEREIVELLGYADPASAPVLAARLDYAAGLARRLREAGPESESSLYLLADAQDLATNNGTKHAWGRLPGGAPVVEQAKGILSRLQKEIRAELEQARRHALAPLLSALARFVLDYAGERRRAGRPEFQDLLVWAADLLADDGVRRQFQARYGHILIDEFQDTDPLQTELALRLASDDSGRVRPGSLFIVGDPKQSIYRFRHADLSALRRVRAKVGDEPVYLTHTRRTHDGLVAWINALFGEWMGRQERGGQPAFVDLVSQRAPVRVAGPAMGVHFFGDLVEGRVGDARLLEVKRIVDVALSVGSGEWRVLARRDRPDSTATRRSKFGDLTILVPGRTSLIELERGLEDAGVPYALEGQSLVFNTQDVRDLVNCLNAIDDPSNEVAIVAALRSPAFGCSDVDLSRWASAGGRFDYLVAQPADGPVGDSLRALRRYHGERLVVSVPLLIEKFVRERRLREVALDSARPRERWRLLQAVTEQARALARAGRPSLRELVEWAIQRRERAEGITDGAASDAGQDAVRIMTVHYAKGLEFPIVLLSGLNAGAPPRSGRVVFEKAPDGTVLGVAVRAQAGFEYGEFERVNRAERAADADEDVRVIYVAATRAQDHLLVSLYRAARSKGSAADEIARRIAPASQLWSELRLGAGSAQPALFRLEGGPPDRLTEAAREAWLAGHAAKLAIASRRATVPATALAARVDLEDTEVTPQAVAGASTRGRGGSSIGRAVHAVLQRVDLQDASSIVRLATDLSSIEGIPHLAREVETLATAVFNDPVVRRAADGARSWREVYVSATVESPAGAVVVEGFIDLVYELHDGSLCIVDYKTDAVREGETIEDAAAPHVLQLGAYVAAVGRSAGPAVGEAWILFARRAAEGLPAAYRLPDLARVAGAATAEAIRLAGSAPAP